MREIDTEHNWFWQEGYRDARGGVGGYAMVPDEVRNMSQRSDYFAGFRAGLEDRVAEEGES